MPIRIPRIGINSKQMKKVEKLNLFPEKLQYTVQNIENYDIFSY